MNEAPIVIVGGGPAGLIAAEILASAGKAVHVYDRKASVGRKFLLAGRGGLNLTHSEQIDSFLKKYREAESSLAPLIKQFDPAALQKWCEDLGQETFTGSSGRIFPKSMKASPVLRAWLARLDKLGVQFHMHRTWKGWKDADHLLFCDQDNNEEAVKSSATLLALGGASWPNLGSDGSWATLLKHSGVEVADFKPSNCGFTVPWSDYLRDRFAGQPLKGISITHAGETIHGEAMIDAKGLEGGAVYALSASIRDAISANGNTVVTIDLRPNATQQDILAKLKSPRGRKSFSSYLQKTLHLSLPSIALLHEADRNVSAMTANDLAHFIKHIPVTLHSPFPLERAISSAGGIGFQSLDKNMMLKNIPGMFVAGEMLDWEAPTGGYLLQATFATGVSAANGILNWLR